MAGCKILINIGPYNTPTTWRILGIQGGLVLVSEGWGVRRLVALEMITREPFFVIQASAPWWLRPFLHNKEL